MRLGKYYELTVSSSNLHIEAFNASEMAGFEDRDFKDITLMGGVLNQKRRLGRMCAHAEERPREDTKSEAICTEGDRPQNQHLEISVF
jgi:hypothetical protein